MIFICFASSVPPLNKDANWALKINKPRQNIIPKKTFIIYSEDSSYLFNFSDLITEFDIPKSVMIEKTVLNINAALMIP